MEKSPPSALLDRAIAPDSGDASAPPADARSPGALQEWELGIVFIGLYLLFERVSFIYPWASTGITPWNPQIALALGVVLMRGLRAAPALFFAMMLSELLVRVTPTAIGIVLLCTAVSAMGYTLAGLALARRLSSGGRIRSLREFGWMLGIVGVSSLLIGTFYVAANAFFGLVEWQAFAEVLIRYWIGDVVGVLGLLPFIVALADRASRRKLANLLPRWETLFQIATAVAVLFVISFFLPGGHVKYFFVLFLPLIWIAARQGLVGAAAALAFIQAGLIVLVQASDTGAATLLELQARMLALSGTGLLLGVVVDERERAQERLRQSLRLAAAGEMAAALAHEVNQPLTALVTYGRACQHMLAQGPCDQEQLTQTVGKITEQAQRVAAIVKRLRDFLRSGTMNLERMAAGEFLAAMQAAFAAEAKADGIALKLKVDAGLPRVMVDRLELEIVLRNLIANALDSIRESSPVRREISLQAQSHGRGFVCMSVIDSGPGIPPLMRERLFMPFSTSKSHGMGIGLAISRAIVTAHGGRLWSEPTAYGSFHLSLPTATGETNDSDR
ncbi:MAG: MASE1 domain-containing protein [Burkholderiales bacterium]|nr:MASE1 domain-containing protein [Burkholderiales bacterium]